MRLDDYTLILKLEAAVAAAEHDTRVARARLADAQRAAQQAQLDVDRAWEIDCEAWECALEYCAAADGAVDRARNVLGMAEDHAVNVRYELAAAKHARRAALRG